MGIEADSSMLEELNNRNRFYIDMALESRASREAKKPEDRSLRYEIMRRQKGG